MANQEAKNEAPESGTQLKELPVDATGWWQDWYLDPKAQNPIEEVKDKKGNVTLHWSGEPESPGLIGYPYVHMVWQYSQEDPNKKIGGSLEVNEGLFEFPLKKIGDCPEKHCIVVVRADYYK